MKLVTFLFITYFLIVLAVAVNDAILFYRHLKPYFKYTLPVLEILRNELEIWQKLNTSQSEDEQLTLIDDLKNIQYSHLSKKSLNLLQINNNQQRCVRSITILKCM